MALQVVKYQLCQLLYQLRDEQRRHLSGIVWSSVYMFRNKSLILDEMALYCAIFLEYKNTFFFPFLISYYHGGSVLQLYLSLFDVCCRHRLGHWWGAKLGIASNEKKTTFYMSFCISNMWQIWKCFSLGHFIKH